MISIVGWFSFFDIGLTRHYEINSQRQRQKEKTIWQEFMSVLLMLYLQSFFLLFGLFSYSKQFFKLGIHTECSGEYACRGVNSRNNRIHLFSAFNSF